ncbi:MAG: cohesin domain-containing protein [Nitrospirota bacterium]
MLALLMSGMSLVFTPTSVNAVSISAPMATVGVGDTFTIPISIAGATEVTSWQFDLAFDPTIVQANSVAEGSFMSAFGLTLFGPGVIDNGAGLISLVTNAYIDLPPNPFGDGVLADIEFTALAPGVSSLSFSNVFLNFSDQGFDIANGQMVSGSQTVPEPATLALLASGLALFGTRRLVRLRGKEKPQ